MKVRYCKKVPKVFFSVVCVELGKERDLKFHQFYAKFKIILFLKKNKININYSLNNRFMILDYLINSL